MAAQATLDAVQKLYIAYLGRAADESGLNFWADAIESGISTIETVATGFTLTPEYKSIYGNVSDSELVEQIYLNTFGRASDPEGKAFWLGQLAEGSVTVDTIALKMINIMGDVDKALVDKKVVASNTYTQAAGQNYDVEAGKDVLTEIGGGSQTPTPTPTPNPTPIVTMITSGAGSDDLDLGTGAYTIVIGAGTLASENYHAAIGIAASTDFKAAVGSPQIGTARSSDYVAASEDYQAQVGTAQVGTAASPDYVAASEDYQAQVGTAQVGTAASPDYVAASEDYQAQVGTAASSDYQAAVGTPAKASASAATDDGYDIISGFKISTDKLNLPETTLLIGVFSPDQTGNTLTIATNANGIVTFGNATTETTIVDKVSALLTAMGENKASAAFVADDNTYVVQGDGVTGVQSSDILIQLTGVSNATDLNAFIV